MIVVLDYGVGNIFSVKHSFEKIGCQVKVCLDVKELKKSDAIVFPGVGNFAAASKNIEKIKETLVKLLLEDQVPALGICLGTHLLFPKSDEGDGEGLGVFPGRVARLPKSVKTPHMGWNNLKVIRLSPILDGINEGDYFYFAHSYYALPEDRGIVAAETDYGISFPSVISSGNIFGVQFHPEKSGSPGELVMRNFMRLIKR